MHTLDVIGHDRAASRPASTLQRAPSPSGPSPVNPLWQRLAMRPPDGPGERMPPAVQGKMERSFGFDFSPVRIHQDGRARAMGARAYAQGTELYFAPGQYEPHTGRGQEVLGHELAHVTQQAAGRVRTPGQALGGAVDDDPALEHEASVMGARAARGEPAGAGESLESRLRSVMGGRPEEQPVQRLVEMPPNSDLPDFHQFLTKSGNVYGYSLLDRTKSLDVEIFGSLFASPRVFKLQGKDGREAQVSLIDHIKAREGVVAFAGNKRYAFTGGRDKFRMNRTYWTWDTSKGTFKTKPGVDEQEARDDLIAHPEEYTIGCAAATKLTVEGGGRSDRYFGSTSDERDWVPGESGFIKNHGWDGSDGLEGENIIYMGLKKFWGHFHDTQTIQPYQKWFDMVNSWNNQTARLDPDRQWPSKGLK
ncbi:MAG TPA: DUF4157 domain-containing protein [Longimicrobiaceae bacterium]